MQFLSQSISACALGVLISTCILIVETPNPAKIPLKKIYPRAAAGVTLFFLVWLIISCVIASFIGSWGLIKGIGPVGQWLCSCLIGILVPQAARLGDLAIHPRLAMSMRYVFIFLVRFDEMTRIYLSKIVNREERKLSYDIRSGNYERAIERLFEFYLIEILSHNAQRAKSEKRDSVFGLARINNTGVKLRLLFRYLGYRDCVSQLDVAKKNPEFIIPTWPSDEPDRRWNHGRRNQISNPELKPNPDRRKLQFGRRKTDTPFIISYVLGK